MPRVCLTTRWKPGTPAPVAVADLDALGPVLAQDTAPQRLVQVEDEALAGTAGQVPGQVTDLAGVPGEQLGRQVGAGVDVHPRVGGRYSLGHERVEVDDDDTRQPNA